MNFLGYSGKALRSFADRRFIAGLMLGLSLFAGGVALSQSSGNGLVMPRPDSGSIIGYSAKDASSTTTNTSDTWLSNQTSVIAQSKQQDATQCASGNGGVGGAMNNALKAHLELASAWPNVESLFSVNSDCFAGLSSIFDLSFAIPSLGSIISAAANAVLEYAKKKICSAVSQVTGMVTGPLNQAIGNVNGYIGNLNGLTGNLNSGGGMTQVDPNLGASYNVGTSGTYTTTKPFDKYPQAVADNNGAPAAPPYYNGPAPGGTDPGVGNIADLTAQMAQAQANLMNAQAALASAQQQLAACQAQPNADCSSFSSAVAAAQQNVDLITSQIASIQQQMDGGSGGNSYPTKATTSKSAPTPTLALPPGGNTSVPPASNASSAPSLTQKLSGLFN